jgi:hypothetical protein
MDLITDHRIYSLSELLQRDKYEYRIPLYQRDYQWTDAQIDDFEDDAFRLIGDETEHFFGTIVTTQNSPEDPNNSVKTIGYVIDGQQRLTTSLLTLTVIKHLFWEIAQFPSMGDDAYTAAAEISPLLFLGKAGTPEKQISRLSANRSNQVFLNSIITTQTKNSLEVAKKFEELPDEVKIHCEIIRNAYFRIRTHLISRVLKHLDIEAEVMEDDQLETLVDQSQITNAFLYLSEYVDAIRTKAIFIVLQVRSWTDAFGVFEGLNNRGLDLSEKDIVKNMILSKAHHGATASSPEYFKQLEVQWSSIESRIADTKFGNFLRHYLLMFRVDVPLKNVLRELNQHFIKTTAEEMLTDLEKAAKAYETLVKPSFETDVKVKERLEVLKAYDTERAFPIALAARLSGMTLKAQMSIFRAIEVLYVRRTIIMHMDNKAIESKLGEIARDIQSNGKEAVNSALKALHEITPVDELFIKDFKSRQVLKSVTARMLMTQIENHLRGNQHPVVFGLTTLEHILPQKPDLWNLDKAAKDRHLIIVNRIGNLSLLTGKANAGLSNKPFKEKKKFYSEEKLKINQNVIDKLKWTEIDIEKRQIWLAGLAAEIWPR